MLRARPHGEMCESRSGIDAGRESTAPIPGIKAGCLRAVLCLQQPARQQPRRLHSHADALGDDRMRLAGGVADVEYSVRVTRPDAGADRTCGKPSTVKLRVRQRMMHAIAMAKDVPQHCFASGKPGVRTPAY